MPVGENCFTLRKCGPYCRIRKPQAVSNSKRVRFIMFRRSARFYHWNIPNRNLCRQLDHTKRFVEHLSQLGWKEKNPYPTRLGMTNFDHKSKPDLRCKCATLWRFPHKHETFCFPKNKPIMQIYQGNQRLAFRNFNNILTNCRGWNFNRCT